MSSRPRLVLSALLFLCWAAAGAAQPAAEQSVVEPPFTALVDDAARYAARYDVPQGEAEARLRAQAAIGGAVDAIRARFSDRLAGIALEHRPAFRLVVLLTNGEPVPDETVSLAGREVPVVYRTDAPVTAAAIRAAIVEHQADVRAALDDPPGLGIDARTGAMIVTVSRRDVEAAGADMLQSRFSELTGVPVEIAVPGLAEDLALVGGIRLDDPIPAEHRRISCTAGFAVTDGTRTALATAAHCPDMLFANATPLPMINAWGAGTQDVQFHSSPLPLAPAFRVGTGDVIRPVTGVGLRARTVAGQFVCHQSFRDGESCAEIVSTGFAPPGDLCAGPCPPTWVAVAGPDCLHGDSGGPVFDGTVALGLVKGGSFRADGRCNLYYYMPIDALPTGWSVLLAGASSAP
ncbi:hypothetical protein [Sphingomonas sp.]|uniref:hypothetical protein n=1 Tax=Sphingomonas sp. TaxID=28214 RepID=UPI003B004CB5